ncbi:MAG: DEAD/DEAH box helicase family protein [Polyangia bacterium]
MKIQFDASQNFQRHAIDAVLDLLEGQPLASTSVELGRENIVGTTLAHLGYGNALALGRDQLLANVQAIQRRNNLPVGDTLAVTPSGRDDDPRGGIPHFSVEMETGTGKTYVYLRTIFELHRRYGFSKFVIAVPSVAIREGVKTAIDLTRDHFSAIYDNLPVDTWVYDGEQTHRIRQFAQNNRLQIMIINVDAFNKAQNVMFKAMDKLSDRRPIDFLRATFPIVIVDEPQNFEAENRQNAIKELYPLCTLRYSATHRNPYNLVYRLGPATAFNLRLVKRIEVDSVTEEGDQNRPFIAVEKVDVKPSLHAKLKIDVQGKDGPKRKVVTIKKKGIDLFDLSGKREQYRNYVVTEIDAGAGFVAFGNGVRLPVGESQGDRRDDVMRVQIRETVRAHFEREQALAKALPTGVRMKVLSLFFIDRVANYADEDGKLRRWFVEEYTALAREPRFQALASHPLEQVHRGYFAKDRSGFKESREGRDTAADDEAYELIMKDKERLLDPDEPLRFIFSHSALREGWDNPNVFQICTLNESRSELKKRQEIGRGLRLPVMSTGERCQNERLNVLTVVANESYREFAAGLQSEILEETGDRLPTGAIENKRDRRKLGLRADWREKNSAFVALWERIKHKTRYSVRYETARLIEAACLRMREMPKIAPPKIVVQMASLEIRDDGIDETVFALRDQAVSGRDRVPDLLGYLQRATEVTRKTLARILIDSGRIDEALVNPQEFLDQAARCINAAKNELILDGIQYHKMEETDAFWEMERFEFKDGHEETPETYVTRLVYTDKSVYDAVEVESNVEREFAEALQGRRDIKFFLKLPRWFQISTPLGHYTPDWAIVLDRDEKERVYFVRETKGSTEEGELRGDELGKIHCGKRHFDVLGVDFAVVTSADEVR